MLYDQQKRGGRGSAICLAILFITLAGLRCNNQEGSTVSQPDTAVFEKAFPTSFHGLLSIRGCKVKSVEIVEGLGGTWAAVKLQVGKLLEEQKPRVEDIRVTVRRELARLGWREEPITGLSDDVLRSFLQARPRELDANDLTFTHASPPGRPEVFFNLRVHVDPDGSRVIFYCEQGW